MFLSSDQPNLDIYTPQCLLLIYPVYRVSANDGCSLVLWTICKIHMFSMISVINTKFIGTSGESCNISFNRSYNYAVNLSTVTDTIFNLKHEKAWLTGIQYVLWTSNQQLVVPNLCFKIKAKTNAHPSEAVRCLLL